MLVEKPSVDLTWRGAQQTERPHDCPALDMASWDKILAEAEKSLAEVELRPQRRVWVAVVSYSGRVHLGTMQALLTDIVGFSARGDICVPFDHCGNPMIAHARDMVIAQFLAGDGTDLIFIDDDIVWEPGALLRLVDHEPEFVAGVYPHRRDPEGYSVRWDTSQPEIWSNRAGLIRVEGVPAGFMRLKRSMLEKMVARYSGKAFNDASAPHGVAWALFDNIQDGREYWGEDYSFCRRWRELGGEVFVDPELRLGHVGYKTFFGTLGDWLRSGRGQGATA